MVARIVRSTLVLVALLVTAPAAFAQEVEPAEHQHQSPEHNTVESSSTVDAENLQEGHIVVGTGEVDPTLADATVAIIDLFSGIVIAVEADPE